MAGSVSKDINKIPEGFTLSMALMDMLPVLFFCIGMAVISMRFESVLFRVGACLVILAGAGKVLWKLIIALAKKNVWILNRQMKYLMPTGFVLLLLSLIVDRAKWSAGAVLAHITSFPSVLFLYCGSGRYRMHGAFCEA